MTPNEKQITHLYIGYFSRAADRDGRDYWVSAANSGLSITQIADSFAVQPEFTAIYGGLSNGQLIDEIYDNLFGRAADAAGKAYWQSYLDNGGTAGQLMVRVMNGAQGDDKITLDNRVVVANDWTATTPFTIEAAQNAIESIGEVQGNGVTIDFGSDVFLPDQAGWIADMTAAWAQWGNHGRLDVRLNFLDLGNNVLAFATPRNELFMGQTTQYGDPITQSNVGVEVNTGRDMNGDLADMTMTIAMSLEKFALYDRASILAHEIGHALGFRTEAFDFDQDFSSQTSWDQWITLPTGTTGQAFFNGPEAMAIYGGPVPIVGYYNATHPDGIGSIMDPYFGHGQVSTVGVLVNAMLHDIGVMV